MACMHVRHLSHHVAPPLAGLEEGVELAALALHPPLGLAHQASEVDRRAWSESMPQKSGEICDDVGRASPQPTTGPWASQRLAPRA